jgi:hypothetical protein
VGEAPSRLLANVCRKLLSEVELLVLLLPPSAFTRLAKLVCNAESAELAVLLLVDVLLVESASDCARSSRSVAS